MGIREQLREIMKGNEEVYSLVGKVKSIDAAKRTCVVEPINEDADLLDVRLQAEQESSTGIYTKPKVGSYVVVTFLGKNTAYIALCSEIDSVEIKINAQTITIDGANGVDISGFLKVASATSDLKSAISELIDLVIGLSIVVVGTAGTVNPTQTPLLVALKAKFATFLK